MADLIQGAGGLAVVCGLLFYMGRQIGARASVRQTIVLAGALVLVLIGGFLFLQDRLIMVQIIPHSGAIVWGNSPLPLIALLAGMLTTYQSSSSTPTKRSPLVPLLLVLLGLVHAIKPFLERTPPIHPERAVDGVVMQTSDSSCSAASAATLLQYYKIDTDEREIAELAFTRSNGTTMLGTYRALRHKADGAGKRVVVLSGANRDELRQAAQDGPVLISVGLPRYTTRKIDPRYERDWGWTPGLRHAVVLFRFLPDGKLEMGDPSVGREKWNVESLDILWNGEGIRLVDR